MKLKHAPLPAVGKTEDLHSLLLRAFPEFRTRSGILDVRAFAEHLTLSHEAIYKWFRENEGRGRLPPKRAKEIIASSEGRLTQAHFTPFIFA